MILVTGGCGYIGSHIVNLLSKQGNKVVVFDSLEHGRRDALLHHEPLVQGDIRDKDALTDLFNQYKVDVVIHCAALVNAAESVREPARYQAVNAAGSENVWQVAHAHGVKHYIYASSAAVYGIPQSHAPLKEDAPLAPTNPYGASKLEGESSLQKIVGQKGNYVIFRFFNVAGAEQSGRLRQSRESRAIMERLFAVAEGDEATLTVSGNDYDTGDGTVVRDFIHVEDIARAVLLAVTYLRNQGGSTILNLGTGKPTSLGELHQLVEHETGKVIPLVYAARNPGDISYSQADSTKAKTTLDWSPGKNVADMVKDGWNAYVHI